MADIAILYPPNLANQDDPGVDVATRIAGASIAAGQVTTVDTNGYAQVADASVTGSQQPDGINIVLPKNQGQAISVVRAGIVAGYDLSALAFGALVYLDTAGQISTTANGTKTVPLGKVVPSARVNADGTVDKLLQVWINPLVNY
jgi:hypothetical protein